MILKNSAKCIECDEEIVSTHRHDFNVHFCKKKPRTATKWEGTGVDERLVEVPGETTWSFGVDGGNAYIRRLGSGFIDTSIYSDEVDPK